MAIFEFRLLDREFENKPQCFFLAAANSADLKTDYKTKCKCSSLMSFIFKTIPLIQDLNEVVNKFCSEIQHPIELNVNGNNVKCQLILVSCCCDNLGNIMSLFFTNCNNEIIFNSKSSSGWAIRIVCW